MVKWYADRDWSWVWEDIAVLLFAGIGAGAAGLIWWQDDDWMAGSPGIAVWRIAALASAFIALLPPVRIALSFAFWLVGFIDCTETCRSSVFLLSAFDGRPATYALVSILAWSFSYQILSILGTYPDGDGGTRTRVRPGQEDNRLLIDQTFGCLLTIAILLGARNALVRYVLWGVLQRQAQEQAQQLERLSTVARRLTAPMRHGWLWPNAGGNDTSGSAAGEGMVQDRTGAQLPARSAAAPAPETPIQGVRRRNSASARRTSRGGGASPGGSAGEQDRSDGMTMLKDMQRANAARLRMYDETGALHSVRREDRARYLARLAFRRACMAREQAGVREGRLDRGRPGVRFGPQLPGDARPLSRGSPPVEGVPDKGSGAGQGQGQGQGQNGPGLRLRRGAGKQEQEQEQGQAVAGTGSVEVTMPPPGRAGRVGRPRGPGDGEMGSEERGSSRGGGGSDRDETEDEDDDESTTPSVGSRGMQAVVGQPYRWIKGLFAPVKKEHKDSQPGDEDLELLQEDFEALVRDPEASEEAFRFFDTSEDGSVSMGEFQAGFSKLLQAFAAAKSALVGQGTVSHAMDRFADFVYGLAAVIVILSFYRVPVASLFVPISSVLLSMSFALGPAISNAVTSFVFVVMVRAYDVGDRVSIATINQGGTLLVEEIDVLTTTFGQPVTGKQLNIANHVLAQAPIENLKRSPNVTFTIDVDVGRDTTAQQLSQLKEAMLTYLAAFPKEWKPDLTLSALDALPGEGCMLRIRFWVRPRKGWQEGAKIYRARSAFVVALLAEMKRQNVEYVMPTRPVRLDAGAQQAASAMGGHLAASRARGQSQAQMQGANGDEWQQQ